MEILREALGRLQTREREPEALPDYFCKEEQIRALYGQFMTVLEKVESPLGADFRLDDFKRDGTINVRGDPGKEVLIVSTRSKDYWNKPHDAQMKDTDELRLNNAGRALVYTKHSPVGREEERYTWQHLEEMGIGKYPLEGWMKRFDVHFLSHYYQPLFTSELDYWQRVAQACNPTSVRSHIVRVYDPTYPIW